MPEISGNLKKFNVTVPSILRS